jgi:hypothetical protein
VAALAVEGADDAAAGVEDRGGHHRLEALQAVGVAGVRGVLPEGALLQADALEHVAAGRRHPAAAARGAADGGHRPPAVLQEQGAAGVQADDLDQRPGGLLQEVRRTDRALQDAHRRLQPADQGVHLDRVEVRQRPDAADQDVEVARPDGDLLQPLEGGGRGGRGRLDRHLALLDQQGERRRQFGGGRGRDGRAAPADVERHPAAVGDPDGPGGQRLQEDVAARAVTLLLPGEHQPGRAPFAGRDRAVGRRFPRALPPQLERVREADLVRRATVLRDAQSERQTHEMVPIRR